MSNLIGPFEYKKKFGFIDYGGNFVIEPLFEWLGEFKEGMASFKRDGRFGFIDQNSTEVIPAIFDCDIVEGPRFSSGLSSVKARGLVGYIDNKGGFVIEPTYTSGWDFIGDNAIVHASNPKKGFSLVDKTGNLLTFFDVYEIPYLLSWPQNWSCFVCLVREGGRFLQAAFSSNGQCVFPPKYPYLTEFYDGVAGFCESDNNHLDPYGLISLSGTVLQTPRYYSMSNFKEGLARVGRTSKQFGFINPQGEWVIKPDFRSACSFSEGLACVAIKGKKGFINKQGEMVIEPRFDRETHFCNGAAEVEYEGKRAFINKTGQVFWETKLDEV